MSTHKLPYFILMGKKLVIKNLRLRQQQQTKKSLAAYKLVVQLITIIYL